MRSIFVLSVLLSIVFAQVYAINPVILIPGYGGAQAYLTKDWTPNHRIRLWLNYGDFVFTKLFTETFKLVYNPTNHSTYSPPRVKIDFPGWGETWSVEDLGFKIHYFNRYAGILRQKLGYKSNKTLRGAPYDFRKAPYEHEQFYVQLKKLIETTYANNNYIRVFLIAHSMGNILTLEFLNRMTDAWKKLHIRGYAAISAPLAGSVKSMALLAQGDNFKVFIDSPLLFREILRSFPSTHLLLPDPRLWSVEETLIQVVQPNGDQKNYTTANYREYYLDSLQKNRYEIYQDIHRYNTTDYFKTPTGVDELYCLYGTGVKTVTQLIYKTHDVWDRALPDEKLYGDGDGSVNRRSLEVCKHWDGVETLEFPGAGHLPILEDKRVLKFLVKTLMITK